ncbi:hypothetical protein JAAARDRAFT_28824 [Jaapia argillacea MUCL 33604]|uniref:Carbohydrate-binding module family 50 protein n=1 Tax=Jaapia argillacea MUCL 33604 TaxID=933084 RepID=A0A067Q785_9AGAM|nr:hypothetical protein JAAARDRAFT_28824 [Jaapia argillacea MUCL 33604]
MGRWTQYDEDDYRLPEGMKRVGYDADTQTYTYRYRDSSVWEGSPGASYGVLTKVGRAPSVSPDVERRVPSDAERQGEAIEADSVVDSHRQLPTVSG